MPSEAREVREIVLVVDDDPHVRTLARDILEMAGYAVLDTGDPREALRLVRPESGRIDLVVTDVVMPLMDGRELATRVKALRPGIKILLMSAFDVSGLGTTGLPFIAKPFDVRDLKDKVHAVLGGEPPPSPFGHPPKPDKPS